MHTAKKQIKFSIPGIPKAWQRVNTTVIDGRAHSFNPQDLRDYEALIGHIAKKARGAEKAWGGPVVLSLVAVFPIPESWPEKNKAAAREGRVLHINVPDLDNITKAIKDGCRHIIYIDDRQVCGFAAPFAKRYGHPARIDVAFTLLHQEDAEITPAQRRRDNAAAQPDMFSKSPVRGRRPMRLRRNK